MPKLSAPAVVLLLANAVACTTTDPPPAGSSSSAGGPASSESSSGPNAGSSSSLASSSVLPSSLASGAAESSSSVGSSSGPATCSAQNPCTGADVCDTGSCRAPLTCVDVACVPNQVCIAPANNQDARCDAACVTGFVWDGSACQAIPQGCDAGFTQLDGGCVPSATCAPFPAAGSIADVCTSQNRACDEPTTGLAVCGACLPNANDDGNGVCVLQANCTPGAGGSILSACTAELRNCEYTLDGGAFCGQCLANNAPIDAGACAPYATCALAPANGTIAAQCDALHRTCSEPNLGAAECDACVFGFIEVGGVCEAETTCTEIESICAGMNRACVETPNAHCDACLPGYVPDTMTPGNCRLPLTCATLSCGAQFCVNPPDLRDAFCSPSCQVDGVEGTMFPGGRCAVCPSCAGTGETGPYLAALSGEDKCICATQPGYYYEEAELRTKPCDADGDGFVRINAFPALTAPSGGAIRTNARCALRTVDNIRLINDRQEPLTVSIPPLDLYETERNDDQLLLDSQSNPPAYGSRRLLASELNSFTKACVSVNGDFNHNGLDDIREWHGQQQMDITENFAPFRPFLPFTYYIELHRSYYLPPPGGAGPGTFVIAEKSRMAALGAGNDVPLTLPERMGQEPLPGGGSVTVAQTYWRQCTRYPDRDFPTSGQTQGFDFATRAGAGFAGMNHHSQFKCVNVVASRQLGDPVNWLLVSELVPGNLVMNACTAGTSVGAVAGQAAVNPHDPALTCSAVATPPPVNTVGWAVTEYNLYNAANAYRRGCVNECVEFKNRCPGYSAASPNVTQCEGDFTNYGKLFCGCGYNYGGASCDVGCPGGGSAGRPAGKGLFLDPNYDLAPRQGYWMCGGFARTTRPTLTERGAPNGYRVKAHIPDTSTLRKDLCAAGNCNTGLSVR